MSLYALVDTGMAGSLICLSLVSALSIPVVKLASSVSVKALDDCPVPQSPLSLNPYSSPHNSVKLNTYSFLLVETKDGRLQPCIDYRGLNAITVKYPHLYTPEKLYPCTYFSCKLSPAKQNYDISNRELLAIKAVLKEWRHWLDGTRHPFTVLTDH